MKFSIIIPSYNQPLYIEETLKNAIEIRQAAEQLNHKVEILVFDSESPEDVQEILNRYRSQLDYIEVKKDKGQYDAINKGITQCSGDYWTWLNTDDTLDKAGILRLFEILNKHPEIDYIYGAIDYIDGQGKFMRSFPAYKIDQKTLITKTPGIFQQGSFFKKAFSNKVGLLKNYNCCFDYEYVLRFLTNGAHMYVCDFKVANFRQHNVSKTGSLTPVFVREQLEISKNYGRKPWNFLSWFSQMRLVKHKLFPRR